MKAIVLALSSLNASPAIRMRNVSSLYETEAVGYKNQADFINGVVELSTSLTPVRLLRRLQQVEKMVGRTREIRWGPRTIDLDILLYDELFYASKELTIPHRELQNRRFALAPLAEIAQDHVVPGTGKSVIQLLKETADASRIRLLMTSVDFKQKLQEV
ncbi:2-amino-4-hydroxy-6-hydroxymethyldihydropteridine diphosphokinase [candidate division KSB1 bacterium]|nr:2-amino-4-hydroxy-6-hydroxymethyldihydropteridine diphosphokinase [candidate division KSB1 bacterium]